MRINIWIAMGGFSSCVVGALMSLPSEDTLSVITADNVHTFFLGFLSDFIRTPFSWVGITLLIIALSEGRLHRKGSSPSKDDKISSDNF